MLNVNVINAKTTQKVEIKQGQPVNLKVDPNTRFELVDPTSGKAPAQIKARRVGDNLEIVTDEKAQIEDEAVSNSQTPDLVLENYFKQDDVSLFAGEGEQAVSYVPVDGAAYSSFAAMNTTANTGAAVAALPLLNPWVGVAAGAGLAAAGGGGGGSTSQVTNKAPVAKDDVKSSAENGVLEGSVPIATDTDGAIVRYELIRNVGNSEGILIFHSNGTYKFYPSNFDNLALGEKTSVSFQYVAVDNLGAKSDVKTISIQITGANDAPEILVMNAEGLNDTSTSSLVETDSGITVSGTLTVTDKDITEIVTLTTSATKVDFEGTTFVNIDPNMNQAIVDFVMPLFTVESSPGRLLNDPHNIVWNFSYEDEAALFFDLIPANESLVINYTIEVNDPHVNATKVVSIKINGTNDKPEVFVLDGDSNSGSIVDLTKNVTGSLSVIDPDIDPDVAAYYSDVKLDNVSIADVDKKIELFNLFLVDATSTFEQISEQNNYDWIFNTADAIEQGLTAGLSAGEHKLTYTMIFRGENDDGFIQDINILFTV